MRIVFKAMLWLSFMLYTVVVVLSIPAWIHVGYPAMVADSKFILIWIGLGFLAWMSS